MPWRQISRTRDPAPGGAEQTALAGRPHPLGMQTPYAKPFNIDPHRRREQDQCCVIETPGRMHQQMIDISVRIGVLGQIIGM